MENPVSDKIVTTTCAKCGNLIDVTGLEAGDGITCPYCANEFPITRQFGNFLLERQVGSGGMGAVYLGRDMTLNRVVAVKVLKPDLVSDQKFLATFLREAEITASLNHPNIVQVYAFGQHEGVYYMVVEYISGGSLDDKIAERGQITELEGIEIGIAVARRLECALQQGGLIHRDIKPGNILFNANNTPKVVDFGLSLSYETTDHFDGEIWGTPYYVAPEKLEREAGDVQERSLQPRRDALPRDVGPPALRGGRSQRGGDDASQRQRHFPEGFCSRYLRPDRLRREQGHGPLSGGPLRIVRRIHRAARGRQAPHFRSLQKEEVSWPQKQQGSSSEVDRRTSHLEIVAVRELRSGSKRRRLRRRSVLG